MHISGKTMKILVGIITGIIVIAVFSLLLNRDLDGISKYVWIERLAKSFNMTEYLSEEAYFSDVTADNNLFACIQSAYEWNVLDEKKQFKGDEIIDGKYVAITSVKTLGKTRIEIFTGKNFDMSDKACVDFAIKNGIIMKSELKKSISLERCNEIIARLATLYFEEMWVDNYQKIDYADNVIELKPSDIKSIDLKNNKLVLNDNANVSLGDKLVYVDPRGNVVGKVTDITNNKEVRLEEVVLEDIVDYALVSHKIELTMDDILRSYGLERNSLSYDTTAINSVNVMSRNSNHLDFCDQNSAIYGGLKLELFCDSGRLNVKVTELDTGLSFTIPTGYKVGENDAFDGSITFTDILINTQYETVLGVPQYINTQFTYNLLSDVGISISGDNYGTTIPLFTVTPSLGAVTVKTGINLYIDINGQMKLGLSAPGQASYVWQKGSSPRVLGNCVPEVNFLADCTMGIYIQPEIKPYILTFNICDLTLNIGAEANANVITRNDKKVIACADLQLYAPIIRFDFEMDTFGDSIDVEFTKDIIGKEQAKITFDKNHFEFYKDGTTAFLTKCSLGKTGLDLASLRPGRYEIDIKSEPITNKGAISIICDIYNTADQIDELEYRSLLKGDVLDIYGHKYTYKGSDSIKVLGFNLDEDLGAEMYNSTRETVDWKIGNDFMFLEDQRGDKYLLMKKGSGWLAEDDSNLTLTNHNVMPYLIGKIETEYLEWDVEKTSSVINSFYSKIGSDVTWVIPSKTETQVGTVVSDFEKAIKTKKVKKGVTIDLVKNVDGTYRLEKIDGFNERTIRYIWEQ